MSPQARSPSRIEIEDRWRTRLADAKRNHDQAVVEFRRAAEVYRAREIPASDGSLGLHQAISAESSARREYIRILRLFTDLVVNGRIPKDDIPGRPAGLTAFRMAEPASDPIPHVVNYVFAHSECCSPENSSHIYPDNWSRG